MPQLLHGPLTTNRRQRVLQHSTIAIVHVHVTARDHAHAELLRDIAVALENFAITSARKQFDGEPSAVVEAFLEPARVAQVHKAVGRP